MKSKYNCTNSRCYITDEPLSPNETLEHIIPNALGGFLKSNKLVLSRINTGLFDKLDAELVERLEIARLFKFRRERGQPPPPIKGTTKDGIEYLVQEGKKVTMLSRKPEEVRSQTGETLLKFPLHQKKEIIAAKLKKNPQLNEEELQKSFIEVNNEVLNTLYFKYNLDIITNSLNSFRAVAKIATNYAVLNNLNKTLFVNFINFIQGENNLNSIQLGYFYPKNFLKYEIGINEISHILYLKACNRERLLYCYIELFNLHCFVVILNYDYCGDDFTAKYIWDVREAKELDKNISVNVPRDFLASRDYMYYPEVEKDFAERFMRLAEVVNLKIKH